MTSTRTGAQPRAATGRLTVNPGDTIVSTWGNSTFDQTMTVFDTAAARDAAYPTPHDGALAYTLDTQTAWLRRSGAWVQMPPASYSRGTLTQAISTTSSPATTTNVDWFTAPAFTVDGTRRIRANYSCSNMNAGTANDFAALRLFDGSTQLQAAQLRITVTGGQGQSSISGVWQGVPAAGTHTYKLNVSLVNGTGPVTAVAGAVNPGILIVEDVGT